MDSSKFYKDSIKHTRNMSFTQLNFGTIINQETFIMETDNSHRRKFTHHSHNYNTLVCESIFHKMSLFALLTIKMDILSTGYLKWEIGLNL